MDINNTLVVSYSNNGGLIKIMGQFDTIEQANEFKEELDKTNPTLKHYVSKIGEWTPMKDD